MGAPELTSTWSRSFFDRLLAVRLLPGQAVALAGLSLMLAGTGLLMLPFATAPGVKPRFLDALFTAASAVSLAGLTVLDTSKDFSLFGQIVIMLLIQLGGLGYSVAATLLLLALRQRIGVRGQLRMAEALSAIDRNDLVRLVKTIVTITFVVEGIGALLLAARFAMDMTPGRALYAGLFHSVSAFNNAGFSLFADSLAGYRSDPVVVPAITVLIVLGGLGFLVFRDVVDKVKGRRFRLQTHTKLVLVVSFLLLAVGMAAIWTLEWNNPATLATLSTGDQALVAYFHSVAARTAGFNTIDLNGMRDATLYFMILLMAIGGSPGSTAGGIKTTTVGIVCLSTWAVLRQKADVELFHRRVPNDLVVRATCLAILAMGTITFLTLILAYTEQRSFLALMFEVTSAIGTAGLSLGDGGVRSLSALFTDTGKILIILSMVLGRFGPLLIGLFAIRTPAEMRYRFPESKVVIG
ncbi:MAG TPA: TrkH family potassium uptake protein [Nitrospiraceae bacterium]|nr:TrkH family potassium uptake protein [Nitrospiraceae bacterium]